MCDCHVCSPSHYIYLCSSAASVLAGWIRGEVLHTHLGTLRTPAFPFSFTLPDLPLRSCGVASVMGTEACQEEWCPPGKLAASWLQWPGPLAKCHVTAAVCFTTSGSGTGASSFCLPYTRRETAASLQTWLLMAFNQNAPKSKCMFICTKRSSLASVFCGYTYE